MICSDATFGRHPCSLGRPAIKFARLEASSSEGHLCVHADRGFSEAVAPGPYASAQGMFGKREGSGPQVEELGSQCEQSRDTVRHGEDCEHGEIS